MRRRLLPLVLLPLLVVLVGAKYEPIVTPEPILVPEGLTTEQVAKSLQVALVDRGWTVDSVKMPEGEGSGEILSTLYIRKHTATIRLLFDAKRVQIEYVESTNLGFKDGKVKKIHNRYNFWIRTIEKDIKVRLSKDALE